MRLTIDKIILYPENVELKPRVIQFMPDRVNIITGYSQRGKSAIISIIDYCLGSKDCNIPIGKIRQLVHMFAIEISLANKKVFIARETPELLESKSTMYYHIVENEFFDYENWTENIEMYKANRDIIKNLLGEIAGFENISEKDDFSKNGFDAPASFRDTTAFQFQTQNIIANPTTIFYNTDSFEHLKRLKTLFPLVLGYKSYEILNLEKQIEVLEKLEIDKEKKHDDIKAQYENWQSDIYEYYSKAISLGLTNADVNIDTAKVNQIKNELTKIVGFVKGNNFLMKGSSLRFSEKLEDLNSQRVLLARQLDDLKNDLQKIEQFDRSKDLYLNTVAKEVEDRLKPIEWFIKQNGTDLCPFCNSKTDKAIDELLSLKDQREQNLLILNESQSREFSFEKEKNEFKKKIIEIEQKIVLVDSNMRILLAENTEYYIKYQGIYEFVGKMEHVLENLNKISPSSDLAIELEKIRNELSKNKAKLRSLKEKFDKEASLKKLTSIIDNYIKVLPIEDKEFRKVRFDPDNSVGIKIEDTKSNYITFLSKLGSGANHMCYHLATLLGLHEYFLKLPEVGKKNYVPSFLIIDQPSQVYFPETFPEVNSEYPNYRVSEDIENTTLIFKACAFFMDRTNYQTQIIILEHAPKETWKDVNNIHLVEEWRGNLEVSDSNFNALIPKDWMLQS